MSFTGGIRCSSISPHAEEQNGKCCRLPRGDGDALLRSAEWSYLKIQSQTSECVAGVSCKPYIIWDRLIKDKMRTESSCRKPNASRQWRWANFLCSLKSTTVGISLRGDVASQNKHDGKPGGKRRRPSARLLYPNRHLLLAAMMPQVRMYLLFRKGIREIVAFLGWEEGTKLFLLGLDITEPQSAVNIKEEKTSKALRYPHSD